MLVCLSANQRTTTFSDLERLSAANDGMTHVVLGAHASIRGAVIVSTCNRFEAYVDIDADAPLPSVDAALEVIAAHADMPYRTLRSSVKVEAGNRATKHLFAVASGLESVSIGEGEIAGQVRRSLDEARTAGTSTPDLEQLFQRASEASREVKADTRLSESGRSLVRLAVDLVGSRITDWSSARVLLIGTGRYAGATLAALRAVGADDIRVFSRSGRRSFAHREGLIGVDAAGLPTELGNADVVLTCTTSTEGFAMTQAEWASARAGVITPQIVIDLGMPRNVEPSVGELAGIGLLDLDTIRLHVDIDEDELVGQARAIIGDAVHRHAVASRVHAVSPAVVDMRAYIDGMLQGELERAASPETQRALRHFAGVLMHGFIGTGHKAAAAGEGDAWMNAIARVLPNDKHL